MRAPLTLLLLLLLPTCGGDSAEDPPDVVLILLDTLRPDHLEVYGYDQATAPWLAALGDRGAVFERAHSTSAWTPPATASLMTGLYPERHGVVHGFELDKAARQRLEAGLATDVPVVTLPSDAPTLAERFAAAGYATVGVATNIHVNPLVGHDRGFDRFLLERDADAGRVAELLTGLLDELPREGPRFVSLHLNDVHRPYHRREPWYAPREETLADQAAAYDSEIAFADEQLASLARTLGWDEDTLVCVASDHGEGFGEGGVVGHGPSLSWVLNRCVLLMAGPGVPAVRVHANASLVDVVPTLLELAGLPPPEDLDGQSLVPLLDPERRAAAEARAAERPLFAHRRHRPAVGQRFLWSVVLGPWKLIHDEADGSTRLYDVRSDPREEQDLAAREPALVARLMALRQEHAAAATRTEGATTEDQQVRLDAALYDHLRALGYAGDDDH